MLGLTLLLVATSTIATASADAKCRSGCGGVVPQTFKFADGTTYQYNYEGTLSISLSSSKGQDSETKVKATVLLTQQPECNQVLRVQNLQIIGDNKRFANIPDIEKPIKLNYHDGHLEDIICTEAGDTQNSLNVKRAIASMFQAALKHHNTEIDVFGSCPTEFSTHKDGNVFVIKKARNLNKCSHRENIGQGYMSLAYDLKSDLKTSPFLQGRYNAEMKIKAGILDTSVVDEDYLYMPFSVGNEGAKVKVHSKMSFVKQTKESPKVSCTVPKSVIFEDPHPVIPQKSISKALIDTIKDTANSIDSTLKKDTAEKFMKIVHLMKYAKKADVIGIYGQVRSGAGFNSQKVARRLFMDALFRAGTGDCVEAAMEMYKNNELTPTESKLFFLRLSFTQHSTPGCINGATDLLDKDLPREALIGLGALVGQYCKQHTCENLPQLNAFLDKLATKLTKPTKATEDQVLSSLKGLMNVGRTNPTVEAKLMELAQDKQGVSRIRSAALDAYKSNPCSDKLRDSALNIMNDIQQDSEFRIKAYLAVAECPNGKVATNVKNLLDKEESYQVGGYIVSHLQTLRTSTNPDKMLAKSQLGNIRTTKKFPFDLMKYSRNMEMSHRWDTAGIGGSLETDIIYSPKSFMPRSTHLNLTTQIFGHSFNFLEIDTRQENLDRLLEYYLGPTGILRKESSDATLKNGMETLKKISKRVDDRLKKHIVKRELTKDQIENFAKTLVPKENEMNKDLDLDFSVKMFGMETLFLSLSEDITKYQPEALVDKIFDKIDERFKAMKSFDENMMANLMFLDADVAYPTSIGFPLKLSVEGISSMNLKTAGKLDIGNFLAKGDGEYKLSLISSADIEIISRMIVDTSVVQRGLKITGNLYTATGGSLDLTLTKDGVDLKYSVPLDKQEIFTATHEIVFESCESNGQTTQVELKQTRSKDVTVCIDQLNPYIGLIFCAHINQPNIQGSNVLLPYPLSGNSKFSITVDKTDLEMIRFKMTSYGNDPDKTGLEMETQVLNKQNKPKATLRTEIFVRPDIYFLTTFNSEKKKGTAELRAVLSPQKEYSLLSRLTVDEIEYYAKIGGSMSGPPENFVFKPIMEYKAGTGEIAKIPYRLEGQIKGTVQGTESKYTMDNLQFVGGPKPVKINGNLIFNPDSVTSDLMLTDGEKNVNLNGKIQYKDRQLNLNAMVKTNFNPNMNFQLKYDVKSVGGLFDSNLQFQHGDLTQKDNIFKLQNMVKQNTEKEFLPFSTKNLMTYPKLGLDNKFDMDLTTKTVKMNAKFGYRKIKLGMELDAKVNMRQVGDYDIDLELSGMENKLELEMMRAVDKNKSKLKNTLEINGKSIKLNGDVSHLVDTNKIQFSTDLNLKMSGFQQYNADLKLVSSFQHNPHETDGSLKISEGSKVMVDAFIKRSKGGNANGSLKVNTNVVNMQGQLKATQYSGTSDLTIDIPKVRKMKAESTFNVNLPTFNLDLSLFTDVGKDDSKKYRVSTTSTFKPDSIDSKNVLEILGKTTTFNIKGTKSGNIYHGKVNGEFDLTLSNDMYFGGKIDRDRRVVKGIAGGSMVISLEQRDNKNTPGRKVTIKAEGKNVDKDHDNYDILYNILFENGNGKNLNIDLDMKGTKRDAKKGMVWGSHVHGTVVGEPIKTKISFSEEKGAGEFGVKFEHGKLTAFDMNGKYHHHHNDDTKKPCTGEFSLDMSTPLQQLKVAKLKSVWSMVIPKTSEDQFVFSEDFSLFVDDDGTDPKVTIDLKAKHNWELGLRKGSVKSTVNLKDHEPVDIDMSYDQSSGKKYISKGTIKRGATKFEKWDVVFDVISKEDIATEWKIESSNENLKNLDVKGKYKYVPDTKIANVNFNVLFNGKKYDVSNSYGLSEYNPMILIEVKYPGGQIDKIYGKFNNVGLRSVSTQTEIKLHKIPFNFDGSLDVQADSMEDFDLKLNIDSPQLKLDKIVVTATTKETKGSNKLIVSAKKGNENLISGSAVYKTREEDGKYIIEGSGTFTIKTDKKSGNFKYTKSNLVMSKHKEDGVEFSLQGSIGDKGIDSEIKMTDKHLRALLSYCEQKKECANLELDSKTTTQGKDGYKNVLEMNVDLRKLGMSHEFGLKSETSLDGWDLDHTVDLHFQSQKSKYAYSLYLHPKKAGAKLTTPTRIMELEATTTRPELGQKGPIKGEILFFLNKKTKPNEKTALTFMINPEFSDKVANLNAEAKLIHPTLKKPMTATYKSSLNLHNPYQLEIHSGVDILPNSDKKIVLDVKGSLNEDAKKADLKHSFNLDIQPLNFKINSDFTDVVDIEKKLWVQEFQLTADCGGKKSVSGYQSKYSLTKAYEKLKINNIKIYDFEADMKLSKDEINILGQSEILGLSPVLSHLEIKNMNTLKFFIAKAATKNPKLEVNAALIPNQIAEFKMDVQKDGKKIDLVQASVNLDQANFMKSHYTFEGEKMKENIIEPIKKATQKVIEETKNTIKKTTDDTKNYLGEMTKQIKANQANFKPITEYYEKELKTLKAEIESDETLKKISESLATVLNAFLQFAADMTKISNEFNQKVMEILQKYVQGITESFEKEMLPKLKEIADTLTDVSFKFFETTNEVIFNALRNFFKILEEHKEELKQIAAVLTSVSQDVNRFIVKLSDEIRQTVKVEYEKFMEAIKALPYYENIKMIIEKIEKGEPVPQSYINQFEQFIKELLGTFHIPAVNQFIEYTSAYIVKKMKREEVNDLEAIQHIAKMMIEAMKELTTTVEELFGTRPAPTSVPTRLTDFLPKVVAMQYSFFNRLIGRDFPSLSEIFYDITLNPLSLLPPFRRYAIIAQGQHIFTFDGKHLTFPGNCVYMLARDVEGEFSILGTYSKGIMTELTFQTKSNLITIKKSGAPTLNGAPTEFPIRTKTGDAFRLYNQVQIASNLGVKIHCSPDLMICVVRTSGFYHNRLRGLLGNPNHEAFDDYVLPNGKIVGSESEFGNSYKMETKCAPVQTVDHSTHHHDPECTKLFTETSTLAVCFGLVKPDLFRQACDHGMAAKVPDTTKAIATAYAAACHRRFIPAILPAEFVKCTNCDKPYDLGDTFSVKTPQKSADIVFAVDVSNENKQVYTDFVIPFGEQLKKELSERGIKDVEFHIITYGGEQTEYESHVTTSGGKMTFKGKFPNLKFSTKPDEDDLETGNKQLDFFLSLIKNYVHDVKLAVGGTPQELAYAEAVLYPFRVEAAKAIVAVTTAPCETGSLLLLQKLRALALYDETISVNAFTVMTGANFKVKDDKTTKNVIGFNKDAVLTFPDCKKKPTGNPDLVKDVSHTDYCSEYTVSGGGNVFVLDNFTPASKANKKFYTQVAAYNVAENMLMYERNMDCKCERDTLATARNTCKVVSSKRKPPSDRKLTRG